MTQTKEEKQKYIAQAVNVFRDSLEKTYLKDTELEFYGIGTHKLTSFLSGKVNLQRLNDGSFKISGAIGKECIKESVKGLPMKFIDWDIFPLVITLFHKDFEGADSKDFTNLEGKK